MSRRLSGNTPTVASPPANAEEARERAAQHATRAKELRHEAELINARAARYERWAAFWHEWANDTERPYPTIRAPRR